MSRTPHPPAVTDRDLPLLLAVYGTLRRGCRNHHVVAGCEPVADGTVAGVLHEIVVPLRLDYRYPLLVVPPGSGPPGPPGPPSPPSPPSPPGPPGPRVVVEVYRVEDPAVLRVLDALEAYDPDDVEASEYVRVRVPLLDDLGAPHPGLPSARPAKAQVPVQVPVQVYAYAGAVDAQGPVLPGGDWCTHAGTLG